MSIIGSGGFLAGGLHSTMGRPHAKKPRLRMQHYQPWRTGAICRNAERPQHIETALKQPRPRRAGDIKYDEPPPQESEALLCRGSW